MLSSDLSLELARWRAEWAETGRQSTFYAPIKMVGGPHGMAKPVPEGAGPPDIIRDHDAAYGRIWAGDPWQCARDNGVPVYLASRAELNVDRPAGSRRETIGCIDGQPRRIYILRDLSRREQDMTLAHELCHHFHSEWGEDQGEAWAEAFIAQGRS